MIVLASKSPRRKELLAQIVNHFITVDSHLDETLNRPDYIYDIPTFLANQKAEIVLKTYPHDLIIGCDTIVVIDNIVLEKPLDKDDAFRMLKSLNNKTHQVITGICILYRDQKIMYNVVSDVLFNDLSDATINAYIATGDPFDKAGGYAIQNTEFSLVKTIRGEYENIVGLPLKRLTKELNKLLGTKKRIK